MVVKNRHGGSPLIYVDHKKCLQQANGPDANTEAPNSAAHGANWKTKGQFMATTETNDDIECHFLVHLSRVQYLTVLSSK